MQEEILALATMISAAGETETGYLALLCAAAKQEWESRLRGGVTIEDCREAFLCAAALTAAAGLTGGRSGGGAVSFTAGAVSVTERGTAENPAKALREEAERLMAPFVEANDFCFFGVRG